MAKIKLIAIVLLIVMLWVLPVLAGCDGDYCYLTISSTYGGSVTEPGEDTFTYNAGTVVNLTAEAEEGYQFVIWTGDVDTIGNVGAASTTITMSANYSITANFELGEVQYSLTIASTYGGSVTEPGEDTFTYNAGTVVNLTAEAEEGYQFVIWTGDVDTIGNVGAASTTITMSANYSITANFDEDYGNLTLLIGGSFPLTGPYPEEGAAVLEAFQHYAQWVNANHKISPWGPSFPSDITLNVTFMDDGANPATAMTNYATLKAQGYKLFRISGSGIATAMKDTLITDEVGATTMASGVYLMTPFPGTIFSNAPIYTDQMAAVADWFMANWTGNTSPRVAYLTNDSFGQTIKTIEMNDYLTGIGYTVVTGCPTVPTVPANPAATATMLSWCQNNSIDLTLGAMLVVGATMTMTQADSMNIGWNKAYNMTIGLCSPAHLTIYLRDTGAPGTVIGDGLVVAGSYPPWTDTGDGVTFCKTLMNSYGGGFDSNEHIMYQHGVVEAMIQVEALRLAMINTGKYPDQLTSADILQKGFMQIAGLDTGGIIPTTITYGIGDVEGARSVRLDQAQSGYDVYLGAYPLRHIY
jgi:hypothetical protein